MEWNSIQSRWNLRVVHRNRNNTLVTDGMAVPYRFYSYLPWIVFAFLDPSGEETQVKPSNLGDEMGFYVFPGEGGQPPEEW